MTEALSLDTMFTLEFSEYLLLTLLFNNSTFFFLLEKNTENSQGRSRKIHSFIHLFISLCNTVDLRCYLLFFITLEFTLINIS